MRRRGVAVGGRLKRRARVSASIGVLVGLLAAGPLAVGPAAADGALTLNGSASAEVRIFPRAPAFPGQRRATVSPSVALAPEIGYAWNEGRDRLVLAPFARLDAHDRRRTHADVRIAKWLHVGEGWDVTLGVDRVFWGVAESRHLVNIINQVDRVEDIDEEDFLGQPMVNLNLLTDLGRLSLFVLPGFRTRTFPGDRARLRGPLPIATRDAMFEARAGRGHIDFAARYSATIGRVDLGLAHFRGTSRKPRLLPRRRPSGETVLVPFYDQIDQTSLDLLAVLDPVLVKLEAITRSGHGRRVNAFVAGAEYTIYGSLLERGDIGLLAEYLYDDRKPGEAPPTVHDNDLFLGLRLTFNDPASTHLLLGGHVDLDSGATALSLEADRRLTDRVQLGVKARAFFNVPDRDPLAAIRSDHHARLMLSYFF